jgi:hypothetical protein
MASTTHVPAELKLTTPLLRLQPVEEASMAKVTGSSELACASGV